MTKNQIPETYSDYTSLTPPPPSNPLKTMTILHEDERNVLVAWDLEGDVVRIRLDGCVLGNVLAALNDGLRWTGRRRQRDGH